MNKTLLTLLLLLGCGYAQAQVKLIKGDSTSTVNLYGDSRLAVIEKNRKTSVKKSNNRTRGYRVQIYNGPDRKLANDIKTTFVSTYPDYRSYILFASPNYRIKVGDFKNKNEAEKLYNSLISLYPSSMIVNDVINVK